MNRNCWIVNTCIPRFFLQNKLIGHFFSGHVSIWNQHRFFFNFSMFQIRLPASRMCARLAVSKERREVFRFLFRPILTHPWLKFSSDLRLSGCVRFSSMAFWSVTSLPAVNRFWVPTSWTDVFVANSSWDNLNVINRWLLSLKNCSFRIAVFDGTNLSSVCLI